VACSGAFKLERLIGQALPTADLWGNDVSLLSCATGEYLAGRALAFQFTGPLAFLEVAAGPEPRRRLAALHFGLEYAGFLGGSDSAYKRGMRAALSCDLAARLDAFEAHIASAFPHLPLLSGFLASDWTTQLRAAIDLDRPILAFPPFVGAKGRAPAVKRLAENVTWAAPAFEKITPDLIVATVRGLAEQRAQFILVTDVEIDGMKPAALCIMPSEKRYRVYASDAKSALRVGRRPMKAFPFERAEPLKATKASKVEVTEIDGARAMFVRSIFLKRSIAASPGMWNFLIWLDRRLAGVLTYTLPNFGRPDLYLMSDVATSREGRLSKLVSRLSLNAAILDLAGARSMRRWEGVETTAVSDGAASMKYRGVYDVIKRTSTGAGYQLQYRGDRIDETFDAALRWWLQQRDGGAGNRGGRGR
jgi:hypothetical protein